MLSLTFPTEKTAKTKPRKHFVNYGITNSSFDSHACPFFSLFNAQKTFRSLSTLISPSTTWQWRLSVQLSTQKILVGWKSLHLTLIASSVPSIWLSSQACPLPPHWRVGPCACDWGSRRSCTPCICYRPTRTLPFHFRSLASQSLGHASYTPFPPASPNRL